MAYSCLQREIDSVGLDNEGAWNSLSEDDASSLLRILSFGVEDERTYSCVSMLPVADGRELYILPH